MSEHPKMLYSDQDSEDGEGVVRQSMISDNLTRIEMLCIERIKELGFSEQLEKCAAMDSDVVNQCKTALSEEFSYKVIDRCLNQVIEGITSDYFERYLGGDFRRKLESLRNLIEEAPESWEQEPIWKDFSVENRDTERALAAACFKKILLDVKNKTDDKDIVGYIMKTYGISDIWLAKSMVLAYDIVFDDGLTQGKRKKFDNLSEYELGVLALLNNCSVGAEISLGNYSGKPIDWIVISKTEDSCELLSKEILTTCYYFLSNGEELGRMLNGSFVRAILKDELAFVEKFGLPNREQLPDDKIAYYKGRPLAYWLKGGQSVIGMDGKIATVPSRHSSSFGVRPYLRMSLNRKQEII